MSRRSRCRGWSEALAGRASLLAIRLALAAVFFLACRDKLLHPRAFRSFVLRYEVPGFDLTTLGGLPTALATLLVPMLELVLGVLLVSGLALQGTLLLTALLYAGFLGLLIQAKLRGLDVASCGCFSVHEGQGPALLESVVVHIVLDSLLLALALWVYWHSFVAPRRREAGATPRSAAVAITPGRAASDA